MKHGFKKDGLHRPGMYEKKFEQGPSNSLGASSPAEIRRKVGNPKDVAVGQLAQTQNTPFNMDQMVDEARRHAAKY